MDRSSSTCTCPAGRRATSTCTCPDCSRREPDCFFEAGRTGARAAPPIPGPSTRSGVPDGDKRGHHIFGWDRCATRLVAQDERAPFQLHGRRHAHRACGCGQSQPELVLSRRNYAAAQDNPGLEPSFSWSEISPANPSRRSALRPSTGHGCSPADIQAGRHHPQFEVWLRMANAQAVGILGPALVLRVAQLQVVDAFGGQLASDAWNRPDE